MKYADLIMGGLIMALSIFGVGFMISTVSIDQWFYIAFAVAMVGLAVTGFMTIYKEVKDERNQRKDRGEAFRKPPRQNYR